MFCYSANDSYCQANEENKCEASSKTFQEKYFEYFKNCTRPSQFKPALNSTEQYIAIFSRALEHFPQFKPRFELLDPMILAFDEFLSDEEVEALFHLNDAAFFKSTGYAGLDENGRIIRETSDYRTSSTYWCQEHCKKKNPIVNKILRRIENVTTVPFENFEDPQFLLYDVGEHYGVHSDWIPNQLHTPPSARIFTFFLYLNDVEEGGETAFPKLNVNVTAKKGKAVMWPDMDPGELPELAMNTLTNHAAMPVIKGIKKSVNVWIRQYHVKEFVKAGRCTI